VFLYLDYPHGDEAKAKVVSAELNDELAKTYGVEGFPTILLTTADGAPYARMGYEPGGPTGYVAHLNVLADEGKKVKALLAAKEKADVDTLKAGFLALAEAGMLAYAPYEWILAAAEAKDPEGTHGLKEMVEKERQRRLVAAEEAAFNALFEGVGSREDVPFEKVRAFLDKSTLLSGNALAQGCALVGQWLLEEKEDPAAAKTYFERALADEWVKTIPPAVQHFERMIQRCDEALNPPDPEKDGEGDEGDGDDDGDDDEGGDGDGDEPK
jgi:hypothetical protein